MLLQNDIRQKDDEASKLHKKRVGHAKTLAAAGHLFHP